MSFERLTLHLHNAAVRRGQLALRLRQLELQLIHFRLVPSRLNMRALKTS